jgi:hypothetical protein
LLAIAGRLLAISCRLLTIAISRALLAIAIARALLAISISRPLRAIAVARGLLAIAVSGPLRASVVAGAAAGVAVGATARPIGGVIGRPCGPIAISRILNRAGGARGKRERRDGDKNDPVHFTTPSFDCVPSNWSSGPL